MKINGVILSFMIEDIYIAINKQYFVCKVIWAAGRRKLVKLGGGGIWSFLIVGNGISEYSQPCWLGLSLIVSL
jgi:hypothetical protein